jgi:hypothetical protein
MAVQLEEIRDAFKSYQTDKGFVHGYDQMYSVVFDTIGNPTSLLEIGFYRGYSAAAWKHLFPEATLQFVDKTQPVEVTPPAADLPLLIMNSARTAITEALGQNFDVVIDDGDHRPDYQWQTFLNLLPRWTKAYIIEDVFTRENVELLRKRLKSKGFDNIHCYQSKFKNAKVRINGEMVQDSYYAIVVYR